MPDITLYFLQASRSIRTAWLLEELGVDYRLEFSERENKVKAAPAAFKQSCGDALGKFPTLKDGDLTLGESGAITEYLCENYDEEHRLLPTEKKARAACQRWIHAAEATFALHALGILYTRWFGGENPTSNKIEDGMSVNVQKDFDWLENELKLSGTKFLVGETVTAADCMMHFSVQFILARELGTKGKKWERVEQWVKDCEATKGYKRAVEKSGYTLNP